MEGDAGTGRLTPNDKDDDSSLPDVTAEDSTSEVTADSTSTAESGDQFNTAEDSAAEDCVEEPADSGEAPRSPSRMGSAWFVGTAAALAVLAGGIGFGGYRALGAHQQSQATERRDAAAVEAAKDCVGATQAPDIGAMTSSAQKIVECGTGAFRSQAILYSGLLVEAYQAANAHVQVSDLRAAVERNNPDGSIDILVPLRVKVSNAESQNQEAGYRLRVTMVLDEGKYRISKLDQVAR